MSKFEGEGECVLMKYFAIFFSLFHCLNLCQAARIQCHSSFLYQISLFNIVFLISFIWTGKMAKTKDVKVSLEDADSTQDSVISKGKRNDKAGKKKIFKDYIKLESGGEKY